MLAAPAFYLLYPPAFIVPVGLAMALISICYFIGMKQRKYIAWVPLAIVAVSILIYVIFRLTIPFIEMR